MDFTSLWHVWGQSGSVGDILHVALLAWLLWITRHVHLIREDIASLKGQVSYLNEAKRIKLDG